MTDTDDRYRRLTTKDQRPTPNAQRPTPNDPRPDQAVHSARSLAHTIAEGSGKTGRAHRHKYTVALGEAGEACAAIGMARLESAEVRRQKMRRVGLMLRAMAG